MVYSLVYFLTIIRGNIFVLCCLSFFALMQALSGSLLPEFSMRQSILLYFTIFSIPVAGWIAALLVEKNISTLYNREFISKTAFIACAALCLQNARFPEYLGAAAQFAAKNSNLELIGLVVKAASAVLKSAAIAAFSLLFLVNIIELPFAWFSRAFGFTNKAAISFAGIRPAVFFLIFIYLFEVIAAAVTSRLWPGQF